MASKAEKQEALRRWREHCDNIQRMTIVPVERQTGSAASSVQGVIMLSLCRIISRTIAPTRLPATSFPLPSFISMLHG